MPATKNTYQIGDIIPERGWMLKENCDPSAVRPPTEWYETQRMFGLVKGDYIAQKYQKIYSPTYWSGFSSDINDPKSIQLARNRETFADTHLIKKNITYLLNGIPCMIQRYRTGNGAIYDHTEIYQTDDGYIIWVISPYGSLASIENDIANDMLFDAPFIKTDDLYGSGAHTFYKRFLKRRYTAKEIKTWTKA